MKQKMLLVLFVLAAVVLTGCASQAPDQTGLPSDSSGAQAVDDQPVETGDERDMDDYDDFYDDDLYDDYLDEPDVVLRFSGENFAYIHNGERNPTVRVQQGDLVRVEYETRSGFHDWVIDAFGATAQVGSSEGVQVLEFVADQAGEFEYYCSVGSHRQQGMFGTLVVE